MLLLRLSSAFEFVEEEASDATSGDGAGGGVVVAAGSLRLRELLRRDGKWDPSPISELFRMVLLALMLSFWARRESMAFCFWLLLQLFLNLKKFIAALFVMPRTN